MDKDFKLGAEGDLDIALSGGKVVLTVSYNGASGSVSVVVSQDPKYFLDKLRAKLPASAVIDSAFAALEGAITLVP